MAASSEAFGTCGAERKLPSTVTVCVPAALKLSVPSGEWLTAPARKWYHTVPGPSVVMSPTSCTLPAQAPASLSGTSRRRTAVTFPVSACAGRAAGGFANHAQTPSPTNIHLETHEFFKHRPPASLSLLPEVSDPARSAVQRWESREC